MDHVLLSPLVLLVLSSFLIETNHGLRILVGSDAPSRDDLLPTEATVSCLTDDEGGEVKEIEMLQITREGVDHALAYVDRKSDQFRNEPGTDFQIHGQVDNEDIRANFLNLTFVYPKEKDSGTYTCVQFYIDQDQVLSRKEVSATLVVDGVNKVLTKLIDRVSTLENALKETSNKECACKDPIADLEEKIKNQAENTDSAAVNASLSTVLESIDALEHQTRQNQKSIRDMDNSGQEVEDRLLLLEAAVINHSRLIKELEELDNTGKDFKEVHNSPVAFSASLKENLVPVKGRVVVFDNAQLNQGQGYDEQSGVFTCPKGGVYAFQLAGQIDPDDSIRGKVHMGIVVNNVTVVKLIVDTDHSKQGAVSDVVTLRKGDTVNVIAISVEKRGGIGYPDVTLYCNGYSLFSGYLVKPIRHR